MRALNYCAKRALNNERRTTAKRARLCAGIESSIKVWTPEGDERQGVVGPLEAEVIIDRNRHERSATRRRASPRSALNAIILNSIMCVPNLTIVPLACCVVNAQIATRLRSSLRVMLSRPQFHRVRTDAPSPVSQLAVLVASLWA